MSRPIVRYVVAEPRLALAAVIEQLGEQGRAALAEGRLFVNGVRIREAGIVIEAGGSVEIFAPRQASQGVCVLARHAGFVAVYKPPLLPTEPDRSGANRTLLTEIARLLGCHPGDLHAVSRLDVGVSGVVLLAQSSSGAPGRPLSHERSYVTIVQSCPTPQRGSWTWPIERHGRGRQAAETRYAVLACSHAQRFGSRGRERLALSPALLALEPVSGRFHQLRIHASRAKVPILGDRVHGGVLRIIDGSGSLIELDRIALHARAIRVALPDGRDFRVEAPVPADLLELWRALGGADSDWDENAEKSP